MPRLVYSPRYDVTFLGLERLHPFDSRKYSRAFGLLRRRFGARLDRWLQSPPCQAGAQELRLVHSPSYLDGDLRSSRYLAGALELPFVALLPAFVIDRQVLRPMRWATMGTLEASRAALSEGDFAVNLSGGYHHASVDRGEGFCVYADVAVAVTTLRREGALGAEDRVLYIDLDAHQGNGVARAFERDTTIKILDIYNREIYPGDDRARRRIDVDLGLPQGTGSERYLELLDRELPTFIDQVGAGARLAFYNAGTDVFAGDRLGGLELSARAIARRDHLVAEALSHRRIPWVMLLSGGYSEESYRLVATSVEGLFEPC